MEKFEPIAVFGIPRSGSTWFGKALAANGDRIYIHEPDNEKVSALGYLAKRRLSRFPSPGEVSRHKEYIDFFNKSLNNKILAIDSKGNKILQKSMGLTTDKVEYEIKNFDKKAKNPSTLIVKLLEIIFGENKSRVVKSVHASLSLEVLVKNIKFKPVILFRHPAAVISSMLSLNMMDADREIYYKQEYQVLLKDININEMTSLERMGLQIGIFYSNLTQIIENHKINFYFFEDLCVDVVSRYQKVYEDLGLQWNNQVEAFLLENNKSGQGYNTKRIASKQPDKWKEKLTNKEVDEIRSGYLKLPQKYYKNDWL